MASRDSKLVVPGFRVCSLALLVLAASSALASGAAPARPRGYPLALSPLEIVDRFGKANLGPAPVLGADERKMLQAAWNRQLGAQPGKSARKARGKSADPGPDALVDAFLFASGATETKDRQKYRAKLEGVVAEAKKATAGAKNNREKGDKLLRFLHAGPMARGYDLEQTTLTAILDTGKFNCVSASALYYLVGTRLGLKLESIIIFGDSTSLGHAAIDLVDGTARVQVEPTNPNGFDWEAKLKKPGVVILTPLPDRKKGQRSDGWGLTGSMYSNRGVSASKADPVQTTDAVRHYTAALCLNAADRTAANNLQGLFVNWGPRAADAGKFEEGVRALTFGLTVAPEHPAMQNNYKVVVSRYILAEIEAGRDRNALAVVRRAAKVMPREERFQNEARWFISHGEKKIEKGDWESAVAVADRASKVVPPAGTKLLKQWRTEVYRRWSQDVLKKGDYDGSAKVLARALTACPDDAELLKGLAFHTQEALEGLAKKGGPSAAVRHYRKLLALFPRVEAVREVGEAHVKRVALKLCEERKYSQAVAAMTAYRAMLKEDSEVAPSVYDRWARDLAQNKQYKAALEKYAEGVKAYPKSELLSNNALVIVDGWAKTAMEKKDWKEAVRIYKVALAYFPDNEHLRHNMEYCEAQSKAA